MAARRDRRHPRRAADRPDAAGPRRDPDAAARLADVEHAGHRRPRRDCRRRSRFRVVGSGHASVARARPGAARVAVVPLRARIVRAAPDGAAANSCWSRTRCSCSARPTCSGSTTIATTSCSRPVLAVLAAAALDENGRAQCVAAALLVVWAAIGITGTRDLLAYNEACALAAQTTRGARRAAMGNRCRVPVEWLAALRPSGESAARRRSSLRCSVCDVGPESAVRDRELSAGRCRRHPGGAPAASDLASHA